MTEPKTYGLIGYPLGHSWSQAYFSAKFDQLGIKHCSYALFPLTNISALPQLIIDNPVLCGLNVTIPYKQSVIPYLDHLSETAAEIGAVNTISINRSKTKTILYGDNTDAYGFEESLRIHHAGKSKQDEKALVLGTGGASKAIVWVLKKLGWDIILVSRNHKSALASKNYAVLTYEELSPDFVESCKLIVNTTPLGMYPDTSGLPPIPYHGLTSNHIMYDLVYNPLQTQFLQKGDAAGCKTIGGLDMLRLQAEKAWEIWINGDV